MTFRDKSPEYDPNGNARVVAIRDLVANTRIDSNKLPRVRVDVGQLGQGVEVGDILLPARGDYYPARLCGLPDLATFPAGQIYVIKPDPARVIGTFLAWYLNQPDAQRVIRGGLGGTAIKSLSKAKLLALPVLIAPLSVQYKIATLQELHQERTALMAELELLNQLEIDAVCRNLIGSRLSNDH